MARFTGNHGVVPTTSAPYDSGPLQSDLSDRVVGIVFSDVAGTLHIMQSINGTDWDVDSSYPISAADGSGFSEEIVGPYYRITFVPGSNGAVFRLAARTSSAGSR